MANKKAVHMTILREILLANPTMSNGEIVDLAIARGVTLQRRVLMKRLSTLRLRMAKSTMKKKLQANKAAKKSNDDKLSPKKVVGSTLQPVSQPEFPAEVKKVETTTTVAEFLPKNDLNPVFTSLAQVNQISELCGGAEKLHRVVEVIQACGGIKPFLKHLDLIESIRTSLQSE